MRSASFMALILATGCQDILAEPDKYPDGEYQVQSGILESTCFERDNKLVQRHNETKVTGGWSMQVKTSGDHRAIEADGCSFAVTEADGLFLTEDQPCNAYVNATTSTLVTSLSLTQVTDGVWLFERTKVIDNTAESYFCITHATYSLVR